MKLYLFAAILLVLPYVSAVDYATASNGTFSIVSPMVTDCVNLGCTVEATVCNMNGDIAESFTPVVRSDRMVAKSISVPVTKEDVQLAKEALLEEVGVFKVPSLSDVKPLVVERRVVGESRVTSAESTDILYDDCQVFTTNIFPVFGGLAKYDFSFLDPWVNASRYVSDFSTDVGVGSTASSSANEIVFASYANVSEASTVTTTATVFTSKKTFTLYGAKVGSVNDELSCGVGNTVTARINITYGDGSVSSVDQSDGTGFNPHFFVNPSPAKNVTSIELFLKSTSGGLVSERNTVVYAVNSSAGRYVSATLSSLDVMLVTPVIGFGAGYNSSAAMINLSCDGGASWISNIQNGTSYPCVGGDLMYVVDLNYSAGYPSVTGLNMSFGLLNALTINFYDATSGLAITQNVSVVVNDPLAQQQNSSTTGSLLFGNLNPGALTVIVSSQNYTGASWNVNLVNATTQVLNAYLSSNSLPNTTVTFYALDSALRFPLENATLVVSQFVGGSLSTVGTRVTDVTGAAQFTLLRNTAYTFTLSKGGYASKTFILNPIIQSSYDVTLTKLASELQSFGGVSVAYSPSVFTDGVDNSFLLVFSSPSGQLASYSLSAVGPGVSYSSSGSSATGQSFSSLIHPVGSVLGDTMNISYNYTDTFGVAKSFRFYNEIVNGSAGAGTLLSNKDEHYGMTIFERIFWGVIVVVIVAGVTTLVAGPGSGLVVGLLLMGYLCYIGLLPIVSILLSMFVGMLLLQKRQVPQ